MFYILIQFKNNNLLTTLLLYRVFCQRHNGRFNAMHEPKKFLFSTDKPLK